MIPHVVVADLVFAALVLALVRFAPTLRTRRLLLVLLAYVLVEAVAHGPMEAVAASLIRRWFP
jgi:hypothetical protein